jgi:hypothetical protein
MFALADTEWERCGAFARVYLKKERDDWGRGRMRTRKKCDPRRDYAQGI